MTPPQLSGLPIRLPKPGDPGAQVVVSPNHAILNPHHKPTLTTLPVEMLDMILANLLDLTSSEHRYDLRLPDGIIKLHGRKVLETYTSLLRVNRRLAQAAKTFMFTQNLFVVMDLDTHLIKDVWRHGYLSCVSDTHLKTFPRAVAHIQWTTIGPTDPTRPPSMRFLLLVSQLPHFIERAKLLDHGILPRQKSRHHSCVHSAPGRRPLRRSVLAEGSPITISIALVDRTTGLYAVGATKARTIQQAVLEPFKKLCSNAIKLKVHGAIDDELTKSLDVGDRKRVVFADAIGHDFLAFILSWERDLALLADDRFMMSQPHTAMKIPTDYLFLAYHSLGKLSEDGVLSNLVHNRPNDFRETWQWKLYITTIDLFLTGLSLLHWSYGGHAEAAASECEFYHKSFPLFDSLTRATVTNLYPDLPDDLKLKVGCVHSGIAIFEYPGALTPLSHDAELAVRKMEPALRQNSTMMRRLRCKTEFRFSVPAYFVGWCDTRHVLNDNIRRKLNRELDRAWEDMSKTNK
ncbi:hypothetical protein MBLNU457_6833t1 [Dothideomycetes sp. NU457]